MQAPYSLLSLEAEQDILPACLHANVGVIAYSVLAGGALSGRHNDGVRPGSVLAQRPAYQQRFLNAGNLDRLRRFSALATGCGRVETSLALSAVLSQSAVTAATVGVQTPDELIALVDGVDRPIEDDLHRRVRAIFLSG
jgi:aryl-alcohol dehydrogenase-like predicted oxidoreductase